MRPTFFNKVCNCAMGNQLHPKFSNQLHIRDEHMAGMHMLPLFRLEQYIFNCNSIELSLSTTRQKGSEGGF